MGDYVLEVWQELQLFNPSGGYSVEIPWNESFKAIRPVACDLSVSFDRLLVVTGWAGEGAYACGSYGDPDAGEGEEGQEEEEPRR